MMRRSMLTLVLVLGLASAAGADTYSVLAGRIDLDSDGKTPLSGFFDADLVPPPEAPVPVEGPPIDVLRIEDFAFDSGLGILTPAPPTEYDGLPALFEIRLADQIHARGEDIGLVFLRAGGELVSEDGDQVTFRFIELRGATAGRATGTFVSSSGAEIPRLLHVEGTVHEVERTFDVIRGDSCPIVPILPPADGGVVITAPPIELPPLLPPEGGATIEIRDGGAIEIVGTVVHSFQDFDVAMEETVPFSGPVAGVPIARVAGGGSSIEGELVADGTVVLLAPTTPALPLTTTADETPTLEELGIRAPDGAVVSYVDGALVVSTEGDLFVEGVFPALDGLVSVRLEAGGNVEVSGSLLLPPEVSLFIVAGGMVDIPGDVSPGPIVVPQPVPLPLPTPIPLCRGLLLADTEDHEVGTFSFLATVATPVAIDVKPWSRRNAVRPGHDRWIPVALLGSDELDVREVDPRSLRLGQGEAPPLHYWRRPLVFRMDVNRDRRPDLVALFDLRAAELAFGDAHLCLTAETREGELLEGCDAVDTLPDLRRHPWHWRRSRR